MITNLLATIVISLSTNVTEEVTRYEWVENDWPASKVEGGFNNEHGFYVFPTRRKGVNPLEKLLTTKVIKAHVITFEYPPGKVQSVTHSETISETNRLFVLEKKEQWN